MAGQRWFERAESSWSESCRDVGSILGRAWKLFRDNPWQYLRLALFLFLIHMSFKLLPLGELDGAALYIVAWSHSFLSMLATLAVMVALYHKGIRQLREEGMDEEDTFVLRLGRTLPYAFCYYLVYDNIAGFLGWGVNDLGTFAFGNHTAVFLGGFYLARLPFLYFICRFGFTVVGAAAGGRVSFKDSWRMSRPFKGVLFLTGIVWLIAKHLPKDLMILIPFPGPVFVDVYNVIYPWLAQSYDVVRSVFFGIVAVVWYEKVRLFSEPTSEADAYVGDLPRAAME